jgi:hypothetical protein
VIFILLTHSTFSTRVTIDTAQVGVEVEFHNGIIKTQIKKPLVKRGFNIIKKDIFIIDQSPK